MRKTVSLEEGYSLFFEKSKKCVKCVAYGTEEHMSGQDIANNLNISRSAVSQILKKSIEKVFYMFKNRYKDYSTIEIICLMAKIFNVKNDLQYRKFFKFFPEEIRSEVYEIAKNFGY